MTAVGGQAVGGDPSLAGLRRRARGRTRARRAWRWSPGSTRSAAHALTDLDREVDSDALLCARRRGAKRLVGELIDSVPGMRWVDAGPLANARLTEPLTPLIITINRRYKVRDGGFRITGRDAWGAPTRELPGPARRRSTTPRSGSSSAGPTTACRCSCCTAGPASTTTSSPTTSTRSPSGASGSLLVDQRACGRSEAAVAAHLDARAATRRTWSCSPRPCARPLGRARPFATGRSSRCSTRSTTRHGGGRRSSAAASRRCGSSSGVRREPAGVRARRAARAGRSRRGRASPRCRPPRSSTGPVRDQWPFHFADPGDPRIEEYRQRIRRHGLRARRAAALRRRRGRGDRGRGPARVVSSPTLVLAGRHDRTCVPEAAEAIAAGVPDAQLRDLRGERAHDVRRGARGLRRSGLAVPAARPGERRPSRSPRAPARSRRPGRRGSAGR